MATAAILGHKQSCSRYMACRVLYPVLAVSYWCMDIARPVDIKSSSISSLMNSRAPVTAIYLATHIFTQNVYALVHTTKTCLEGSVRNAMALRLVVEQFIKAVGYLNRIARRCINCLEDKRTPSTPAYGTAISAMFSSNKISQHNSHNNAILLITPQSLHTRWTTSEVAANHNVMHSPCTTKCTTHQALPTP